MVRKHVFFQGLFFSHTCIPTPRNVLPLPTCPESSSACLQALNKVPLPLRQQARCGILHHSGRGAHNLPRSLLCARARTGQSLLVAGDVVQYAVADDHDVFGKIQGRGDDEEREQEEENRVCGVAVSIASF